MIEDKLSHDERVRLECLAVAANTSPHASAEGVIDKAGRYEKFINGERNNNA